MMKKENEESKKYRIKREKCQQVKRENSVFSIINTVKGGAVNFGCGELFSKTFTLRMVGEQ